jgi:hypothetical protein
VAATGFFVSRPAETVKDWVHTYVVTARHVIDQIAAMGSAVFLRINTAGGARWFECTSRWLPHHNDDVDVAITRFDATGCDYRTVSTSMFIRDQHQSTGFDILSTDFGLGDEVLITGLFFQHMGTTRNHPLVRVGTVAALRKEPLLTQVRPKDHPRPNALVDAYLVETRSQSRLSGSPAFIYETRRPNTRYTIFPDRAYSPKTQRPIHLLGLVQGHYYEAFPSEQGEPSSIVELLNVGISVVIPSERIMDVLTQDDVLSADRIEERALLESGAKPASD